MLAWHCKTSAEEWLLCKINYHQMLKSLFDSSHWRGNPSIALSAQRALGHAKNGGF
jgi:hypothetical protein